MHATRTHAASAKHNLGISVAGCATNTPGQVRRASLSPSRRSGSEACLSCRTSLSRQLPRKSSSPSRCENKDVPRMVQRLTMSFIHSRARASDRKRGGACCCSADHVPRTTYHVHTRRRIKPALVLKGALTRRHHWGSCCVSRATSTSLPHPACTTHPRTCANQSHGHVDHTIAAVVSTVGTRLSTGHTDVGVKTGRATKGAVGLRMLARRRV